MTRSPAVFISCRTRPLTAASLRVPEVSALPAMPRGPFLVMQREATAERLQHLLLEAVRRAKQSGAATVADEELARVFAEAAAPLDALAAFHDRLREGTA